MTSPAKPPGKIGLAIRELHRSERSLAASLRRVADRHHAEHGIHHVALDLAGWSDQHVRELAEEGRRYGIRLTAAPPDRIKRLTRPAQRHIGELAGRRPELGLLLLADLRRLHRKAAGVSVDWDLLGQSAHAAKNTELLDLAARAHPQTVRQAQWAEAMLKELSPQVLAS